MKRVYIVLKHAMYPHGITVEYTKDAKILSVFANKKDADAIVAYKDKNNTGKYSVITKLVLDAPVSQIFIDKASESA